MKMIIYYDDNDNTDNNVNNDNNDDNVTRAQALRGNPLNLPHAGPSTDVEPQ